MSCLQAENQGVKCACFLQHKIFPTYIIGIFCECVSWRQFFYTTVIFAVLFGGVRNGTDGFMGVSESVEIILVLSKFLPCSTKTNAPPPSWHMVPISLMSQCFQPIRGSWDHLGERRGKILSPRLVVLMLNYVCWVFSMFYRCRMSSVTLASFWRELNWCKGQFLATKTLSSICIQKSLLNRWCPELTSLNSFWSCWNFKELLISLSSRKDDHCMQFFIV